MPCVVAVLGAALVYDSICICCSSPEADTQTVPVVDSADVMAQQPNSILEQALVCFTFPSP